MAAGHHSPDSTGAGRANPGRAWPASLVALTFALLAPGLATGPMPDAAVFVLIGRRVADGGMPYRDLWDHKPPAIYILDAIGDRVLPFLDPWWIAWTLSFAATALAVVLTFRLLAARVSRGQAWFWAAVCAVIMSTYATSYGGGYTENFAAAAVVAALALIDGREIGARTALAAGTLLGIACLFSVLALAGAAGVGLAILFSSRDWRRALARAVLAAGAGAAVIALVAAWLIAGGAGPDAYDQVVAYVAAYGATPAEDLGLVVNAVLLLGFLVPAGAFVFILAREPRAPGIGRTDWACAIWAIAFLAFLVYLQRSYSHYLILVGPPLGYLAGRGTSALMARLRATRPSPRPGTFAVLTATGAALIFDAVVVTATTVSLAAAGMKLHDSTARIAAWLDANTPATASVYVWGQNPALYLVADRGTYGRYPYQYPLITHGYWTPAKTAELLAEWQADPPDAIVEVASNVPLFAAATDNGDGRDYDTLGPLRQFVRDHYRRAATDAGDIYVLVAGG